MRPRATITALVLAAILAAGAALRLHGIGERGFWLDEAYSELRSRGTLRETFQEGIRYEGSPPLYLLMLNAWRNLAGGAHLRAMSALLDGLTILAVFALARQMLGRAASLTAAGMYAVSSFAIYYAQEARQYALFGLLATLSSYFFLRLAAGRRKREYYHYILYVLTTAGALYAFPYALFMVAAQGLCALAQIIAAYRRGSRGYRLTDPVRVLACLAAAAALYAPYLLLAFQRARLLAAGQGAYAGGLKGQWDLAAGLPEAARHLLYGFDLPFAAPGWMMGVFALLFVAGPAALGAANLPRGSRLYVASLLVLPLAGTALMPYRAHAPEAKHFIFLLPPLIVAICALLFRQGRRRALTLFAEGLIVVAIFAALHLFALEAYYRRPAEKEAWREVAPALTERLRTGDVIVFSPFQGAVPFEYYLPRGVEKEKGLFAEDRWRLKKNGEDVVFCIRTPLKGWSNGPVYYTSEEMEGLALGARRVWLVTDASKVAREVPAVSEALERALSGKYDEVEPAGMSEEYAGTAGTIYLRLFIKR